MDHATKAYVIEHINTHHGFDINKMWALTSRQLQELIDELEG